MQMGIGTERMSQVTWSTHWRCEISDVDAVLSAGADRRMALHGLDDELRTTLERWSTMGTSVEIRPHEQRLADRLVEIGALVDPAPVCGLEFFGDPAFTDKLGAALEVQPTSGGLGVLVRTGADWPTAPVGPHLAVDCSHHHTLVLGPYVMPGLTSCTSCLQTRMARRWPAVAPADAPAIQRHVHLIAELLGLQVELIGRNASPLVNATVAWDLEQGTTDRQTLLKSPGCATCDLGSQSGRIALPWSTAQEVGR